MLPKVQVTLKAMGSEEAVAVSEVSGPLSQYSRKPHTVLVEAERPGHHPAHRGEGTVATRVISPVRRDEALVPRWTPSQLLLDMLSF